MTALLNVTNSLAYFIGAWTILFLGGSVWWVWRRRKNCKSSDQIQPTATGYEVDDFSTPNKGDLHPTIERQDEPIEGMADCPPLLSEIAESCVDPRIRSFMDVIVDRVSEEEPEFGDDTPLAFIEEIVDRIDDLKLLSSKAAAEDASRIEQFSKQLKELLGACGVELLQSDTWNPDIQRALTKTPTEGISQPQITSFGSTGISRHSKLTRKQEVLLAVPLETK